MDREDMKIEQIPRSFEKPFRDAVGHAIKNEIAEMADGLGKLSDEQAAFCIGFCATVAGFVVIDVCGREWPDEDNLRGISQHITEGSFAQAFGLKAEDSYAYITRAALGFEPLDAVFQESNDRAYLPFVIASHLLGSFRPREVHWWEYLDIIEMSVEATARMDLAFLPSLMLRSRRLGNPRQFGEIPR
jgi:hypothetical protein